MKHIKEYVDIAAKRLKIDYNGLTAERTVCLDCRKLPVNCTCEDDALQTLAEQEHGN